MGKRPIQKENRLRGVHVVRRVISREPVVEGRGAQVRNRSRVLRSRRNNGGTVVADPPAPVCAVAAAAAPACSASACAEPAGAVTASDAPVPATPADSPLACAITNQVHQVVDINLQAIAGARVDQLTNGTHIVLDQTINIRAGRGELNQNYHINVTTSVNQVNDILQGGRAELVQPVIAGDELIQTNDEDVEMEDLEIDRRDFF